MKKKAIIICTAVLAIFAIAVISYAPPLIQTSALNVTYECEGRTNNDACVFTPLLVSGVYYIHLPQSAEQLYRWFLIKDRQEFVAVPTAIWERGHSLRYVHRDQIMGVGLLDPKIEDKWFVEFKDKTITFSNGRMTIKVEKR